MTEIAKCNICGAEGPAGAQCPNVVNHANLIAAQAEKPVDTNIVPATPVSKRVRKSK